MLLVLLDTKWSQQRSLSNTKLLICLALFPIFKILLEVNDSNC